MTLAANSPALLADEKRSLLYLRFEF